MQLGTGFSARGLASKQMIDSPPTGLKMPIPVKRISLDDWNEIDSWDGHSTHIVPPRNAIPDKRFES